MRGSLRALISLIRSLRVVMDREEAREEREVGCLDCIDGSRRMGLDSKEVEDGSSLDAADLEVDTSCDLRVVLPLLGAAEANEKVDIRSP